MGLLGNGTRTNANGAQIGGVSGIGPLSRVDDYGWRRWVSCQDGMQTVLKLAGKPYGYYLHRARYKPIQAGAMAGNRYKGIIALDATASGAEGRGIVAAATITLDGAAVGGVVVSGIAAATLALDGAAGISGILSGVASATVALDGAASIAAIGHMIAAGEIDISGAVDMYAIGWMVATDDVSATLTVESIVTGILEAMAADHNVPNTIGAKINSAAAGGVDYASMADAVRAELGVELSALIEVWRRHGLDIAAPLTQSTTAITAGTIDLAITGDPDVSITVTRQP